MRILAISTYKVKIVMIIVIIFIHDNHFAVCIIALKTLCCVQ